MQRRTFLGSVSGLLSILPFFNTIKKEEEVEVKGYLYDWTSSTNFTDDPECKNSQIFGWCNRVFLNDEDMSYLPIMRIQTGSKGWIECQDRDEEGKVQYEILHIGADVPFHNCHLCNEQIKSKKLYGSVVYYQDINYKPTEEFLLKLRSTMSEKFQVGPM